MEYLKKPAFWAHVLSSVAMVTAIILLAANYKKIMKLDALELVKMFSVLAIAIAAHGQGHINLEREYDYDPVKSIFGY